SGRQLGEHQIVAPGIADAASERGEPHPGDRRQLGEARRGERRDSGHRFPFRLSAQDYLAAGSGLPSSPKVSILAALRSSFSFASMMSWASAWPSSSRASSKVGGLPRRRSSTLITCQPNSVLTGSLVYWPAGTAKAASANAATMSSWPK